MPGLGAAVATEREGPLHSVDIVESVLGLQCYFPCREIKQLYYNYYLQYEKTRNFRLYLLPWDGLQTFSVLLGLVSRPRAPFPVCCVWVVVVVVAGSKHLPKSGGLQGF
jgi:hypothetical protein